MKQSDNEEILQLCLEMQKNRPNITREEMKEFIFFHKKEKEKLSVLNQKGKSENIKTCKECGEVNEVSAFFCAHCGKKLSDAFKEGKSGIANGDVKLEGINQKSSNSSIGAIKSVDNEHNHKRKIRECKSCGAEISTAAIFCTKCGCSTNDAVERKKKNWHVGSICSCCEYSIEFREPVSFCPKCGEPYHTKCWEEHNRACIMPDCGWDESLEQPDISEDKSSEIKIQTSEDEENDLNNEKTLLSDIANKITDAAGIDMPQNLKISDVFSSVLKKHTEAEVEQSLIVGTSKTTPNIEEASDLWPRPWIFARILFLCGLTYVGLYVGFAFYKNPNFIPGLIFVGSFMMPFSLLIFFWEANAPQNISVYSIMKYLFLGGTVSLVVTMILYNNIGKISALPLMIGIIEEIGKLLPIIWLLRTRKYKYILNGLLIGAAIGAGFAAFESAGYAFRVHNITQMYNTILLRGLLTPGGHVVWAALSGAALCMVKGKDSFRWKMLVDPRFLRIFLIVIGMHAAWDVQFLAELTRVSFLSVPLHLIILTIISWVLIFAVMSIGLKEISGFQKVKKEGCA